MCSLDGSVIQVVRAEHEGWFELMLAMRIATVD